MPPRRMRWGRVHPELRKVISLLNVISAGPRWAILRVLAGGRKTSSEIHEELALRYNMPIPKSLLYYHLDFLESFGLIAHVGYQETGKGGAPEKVWELKVRRIIIDIEEGSLRVE